LIVIGISHLSVNAQDNTSVLHQHEVTNKKYVCDTSKMLDLGQIIMRLSKKKKDSINVINIQPNKYHFSFVPAVGYTLQTGFAGIASADVAYKTDKNPDTKMSNLLTSFTYSQYHQSIIPLQADIWTKNNKYNIVSDNRFIQYPSDIYGLGGRTDPNKGVTINFSGLKLHETVFKAITKDLYLGLGIYYDQFWNIKSLDTGKNSPPPRRFGKELGTDETASGLAIKLLYDNRLNQLAPSNGWYINTVYRPNFTFMGSQTNWQSLLIDVRKYITFPKNSDNVLCFWNLDWLTTSGNAPYLLLPSTGWDDQYNSGRGYIQGRFRGDNMYYFESEYRFKISRNGLLGGVVFGNLEKFSGEISKQFSNVAPGAGVGIRIKLNKYSGANLCIDYGIGENGSRGFFVNLGEVF